MRRGDLLMLGMALTGCGSSPASAPERVGVVTSAAPPSLPVAAPVAVPGNADRRHPDLPLAPDRALPAVFRGVTTDSAWDVPALAAAIRAHAAVPFVRIVLDPGPRPDAYRPVIAALRPHAYLGC